MAYYFLDDTIYSPAIYSSINMKEFSLDFHDTQSLSSYDYYAVNYVTNIPTPYKSNNNIKYNNPDGTVYVLRLPKFTFSGVYFTRRTYGGSVPYTDIILRYVFLDLNTQTTTGYTLHVKIQETNGESGHPSKVTILDKTITNVTINSKTFRDQVVGSNPVSYQRYYLDLYSLGAYADMKAMNAFDQSDYHYYTITVTLSHAFFGTNELVIGNYPTLDFLWDEYASSYPYYTNQCSVSRISTTDGSTIYSNMIASGVAPNYLVIGVLNSGARYLFSDNNWKICYDYV